MKLIVVTESFYPLEGGAERQMRQVLEELAQTHGWRVGVVARRLKDISNRETVGAIDVVRVMPRGQSRVSSFVASLSAAITIRRQRPDVVIGLQLGFFSLAAVISALGLRRRRPAVILRLAGGFADVSEVTLRERRYASRAVTGWMFRAADAIVSPARHLLVEDGALGRLLEAKGVQIRNGVNERPHRGSNCAASVVWVGRDVPVKGLDDLIECAEMSPDLQFVAVGPAPTGLGPSNLRRTGWLDEPENELHPNDVFVSTSRYEGSPNAALEALSCGMRVVAYDIAGYRELDADFPGWVSLIEPLDVAALSSAVRSAFDEGPPRNGRPAVSTIAEVSETWARLAMECMSRRRPDMEREQ